jgi:hypothetical protein
MGRRSFGRLVLGCAASTALPLLPATARADTVDVLYFDVVRGDGAVAVDAVLRVALPATVEDALRRGVPLYFRAEATLYRSRWYWLDQRVGRATRQWRLSYQPLTGTFRVGIGGLNQGFESLAEAMAAVTRLNGWRVADASDVEPGQRYYLEFGWQLDTSQLPRPMQIGIGNLPDWALAVQRTVALTWS